MPKIVLTGYMGSGKSTVSRLLASKMGCEARDLDTEIEREYQMSVTEFFAQKGELAFRRAEHEKLAELLSCERDFVLATGGGTPCYFNNHELLQKDGITTIYLKASVATLLERLAADGASRPLLGDRRAEERQEFIAKHLFERSYFYNQAQITQWVDGKSPEEIVSDLLKKL